MNRVHGQYKELALNIDKVRRHPEYAKVNRELFVLEKGLGGAQELFSLNVAAWTDADWRLPFNIAYSQRRFKFYNDIQLVCPRLRAQIEVMWEELKIDMDAL